MLHKKQCYSYDLPSCFSHKVNWSVARYSDTASVSSIIIILPDIQLTLEWNFISRDTFKPSRERHKSVMPSGPERTLL